MAMSGVATTYGRKAGAFSVAQAGIPPLWIGVLPHPPLGNDAEDAAGAGDGDSDTPAVGEGGFEQATTITATTARSAA